MAHGVLALGASLMAMMLANPVQAATAERNGFGKLADGRAVERVVLTGRDGTRVSVVALGAAIQSIRTPDRDGRAEEVTLGYSDVETYVDKPQYFGVSVGRFANRIAGGRFTLDGRDYTLETNDGPNHLHGGVTGFDKQLWEVIEVVSGAEARVVLRHVSPDGAGGYPGTLTTTATYTLDDKGLLTLRYRATTDKPTIVNLTNHVFFNLTGDVRGSALDHRLTLHADKYTPVDATLIPTGELRSVAGTPFDFRTPQVIGARIRDGGDEQLRLGHGYDHNYVVNGRAGALRPAARLEDPVSGRVVEIETSAPGVQFYSGNFLDGSITGHGGRIYRMGDGLCFEPQTFPDAPNRPDFPTARLDPGQTYENVMAYRFSVARR